MRNSALTFFCSLFLVWLFAACNTSKNDIRFYYGADLSYVNEMEDCGAIYKNTSGEEQDPYVIFKDAGANLIRLRLWHNPDWTNYSNYEDVKKSIRRAKEQNIRVLLDFHYSDNWADPEKQEIPAAWRAEIDNTKALSKLLYDYTYSTLMDLANHNLAPDIVQVGNEINPMILQEKELKWPIDWSRNSALLNSGIKAVRDASRKSENHMEVMLHIAQPENGLWWFKEAHENGIADYDWIGLSYYPAWSDYTLDNIQEPLSNLIQLYEKRLMVVETAYPFSMENLDEAGNILGDGALIEGFEPTQQGQLDYLLKLEQEIETAGGEGLIYWEPAWVSTSCKTRWGTGSHWDNATLFDKNKMPTLGLTFYNGSKNDE